MNSDWISIYDINVISPPCFYLSESLSYPTIIDQTKDLLWETKLLYQQRRDIPLTDLMSCEKCPVKVYKKTECPFCTVKEQEV